MFSFICNLATEMVFSTINSDDSDDDLSLATPSEFPTDTDDDDIDADGDNEEEDITVTKNAKNFDQSVTTKQDGGRKFPNLSNLFSSETLIRELTELDEKTVSNVLYSHKYSLMRFLESRQTRGESTVSKLKFCETLMTRHLITEQQAERIFAFFDCDSSDEIDISTTLDILRKDFHMFDTDDVSVFINRFEKRHLLPGVEDVLSMQISSTSSSSSSVDEFCERVLRDLRKVNLPANLIPYTFDARASVVSASRDAVARSYLQTTALPTFDVDADVDATRLEFLRVDACVDSKRDKLLPSSQVYKRIETSSKSADVGLMTDGDSSTYWQSDGTANTHWIRAVLRKDVLINALYLGISSNDSSYMPQHVIVSLGDKVSAHSALDGYCKEYFIKPDFTGDFQLLTAQRKFYRYVQVNIKRCLSEGCDTRIRKFRLEGYHLSDSPMTSRGVRELDETCSLWYLNVLTSVVEACLPMAPTLRQQIVQLSMECVDKFQPFVLASGCDDDTPVTSSFLTLNVLNKVDQFILKTVLMDNNSGATYANFSAPPLSQDELVLKWQGMYLMSALALAKGNLNSLFGVLKLTTNLNLCGESGTPELSAKFRALTANALDHVLKNVSQRISLDFVESDGDKKSNWNTLMDNSDISKTYFSCPGKKDFTVCYEKLHEFFLLERVTVVLSEKSKHASAGSCVKRIVVYVKLNNGNHSNRCQESERQLNEEFVHIIGDSTKFEHRDCEIRISPFVTSRIFVKFIGDSFTWSEKSRVEANSLSCYGVFVEKDVLSNADNFPAPYFAPPVTSSDVSRNLLVLLNCLLSIQQRDVIVDNTCVLSVNLSKRLILDFRDLRLKTLNECLLSILRNFDDASRDRRRDEATTLLLLLFLSTVRLVLKYFSKLIIIDGDNSVDKDSSTNVLFNTLTVLTNDSDSRVSRIAVQIICDGASLFFRSNKDRRAKLLSLLKRDVNNGESEYVSKVLFELLCDFFSGFQHAALLNLPNDGDDVIDDDVGERFAETTNAVRSFYDHFDFVENVEKGVEPNPSLKRLILSQEFHFAAWRAQRAPPSVGIGNAPYLLRTASQLSLFSHLKMALKFFLVYVRFYKTSLLQNRIFTLEKNDSKPCTFDVDYFLTSFLVHYNAVIDETLPTNPDAKFIDLLIGLNNTFCREFRDVFSAMDEYSTESTLNGDSTSCAVDEPIFQHEKSSTENTATNLHILRIWKSIESSHSYDSNSHAQKVFFQPGSLEFEITFDDQTELANGSTELRFVFHSDKGETKWGYRFDVKAKCPKLAPCQKVVTLYSYLYKIAGKICSLSLASSQEIDSLMVTQLWKPIFSKGKFSSEKAYSSSADLAVNELLREYVTSSFKNEEVHVIFSNFVKEFGKTKLWLGSAIEQNTFAAFSVFIWHCSALKMEFYKNVVDTQRTDQEKVANCSALQQVFEKSAIIGQRVLELRQNLPQNADALTRGYFERVKFLLENSSAEFADVETGCSDIADFLLDITLNDLDVVKSGFERLTQIRNLHISALSLMSEVLRDDNGEFNKSILRTEFLDVIFISSDWMNGCFMDQHVTDLFVTYFQRLSAIFANARDTKISLRFQYYIFITLSAGNLPTEILRRFAPDFMPTILKSAFSRHLQYTIYPPATYDVDALIDAEMYKSFIFKLKKCRRNDRFSSVLFRSMKIDSKISRSVFVNNLFFIQYSDSLKLDVTCTGCGKTISSGVLYFCSDCQKTTFCKTCFQNGTMPALHFQEIRNGKVDDLHRMIRFDHTCDQCLGYIAGTRYHCEQCEDYDLCEGCYKWALMSMDDHGDGEEGDSENGDGDKGDDNNNNRTTTGVRKKSVSSRHPLANSTTDNACHEASHSMVAVKASTFVQLERGVQLMHEYLSNYSWLLLTYFLGKFAYDRACLKELVLEPILNEVKTYFDTKPTDVDGSRGDKKLVENDGVIMQSETYSNVESKYFGILSICSKFCRPNIDGCFFESALKLALFLLRSGDSSVDEEIIDPLILYEFYGRLLYNVDPATADRVLNEICKFPVAGQPDGYLSLNFLCAFATSLSSSRDMRWASSAARILCKLCSRRDDVTWSRVVENYLRSKLVAYSLEENAQDEGQVFYLLLLTGFPACLQPYADVRYFDSGRVRTGVLLKRLCSSSTAFSALVDMKDISVDETFLILDLEKRKKRNVCWKNLKCRQMALPFAKLLDFRRFFDSDKCDDFCSNPILKSFYLKALNRLSPDLQNDAGNSLGDLSFLLEDGRLKRVVNTACKSVDVPVTTSRDVLETVVRYALSRELPFEIRSLQDSNRSLFKLAYEILNAWMNKCKGDLADLNVHMTAFQALYESKGGDWDKEQVKQVCNGLDNETSDFVRTILYRATILLQNESQNKKIDIDDITCELSVTMDVGCNVQIRETSLDDVINDDILIYERVNMAETEFLWKNWIDGLYTPPLVRPSFEDTDDVVVSQRKTLNDNLLATVLTRLFAPGEKIDQTGDFQTILHQACWRLNVLYCRKLLAKLFMHFCYHGDLSTFVNRCYGNGENKPPEDYAPHLNSMLNLINLFYVTEDLHVTSVDILKKFYDCLPPSPNYVKQLCFIACQYLQDGAGETYTCRLNNFDNKSVEVVMKRCTKFMTRFKAITKKGTITFRYRKTNDATDCLLQYDCSAADRKFVVPANRCTVEFECDDKLEGEISYCQVECNGLERPGRFALGQDLLSLLLSDVDSETIDLALPWKLVWLWTIDIALTCHAKFRLKAMSLLIRIMQIFVKTPSKYRHLNIELHFLRPFWSILKPLNNTNDGLPSLSNAGCKIVSDLTRTCLSLFSLAEQLAIDWHVTDAYAADYAHVTSCTSAYVQGVNVVAALSAQLGLENKATDLMLAFCQKMADAESAESAADNADDDVITRMMSPTFVVETPTETRSRTSSESSTPSLSLPTLLNSFADI